MFFFVATHKLNLTTIDIFIFLVIRIWSMFFVATQKLNLPTIFILLVIRIWSMFCGNTENESHNHLLGMANPVLDVTTTASKSH